MEYYSNTELRFILWKAIPVNRSRRPIGLSDVKGFHNVYTIGSQMAVKLSASRTIRVLLYRIFFSVSGNYLHQRLNTLQGTVRLERSGKLIKIRSNPQATNRRPSGLHTNIYQYILYLELQQELKIIWYFIVLRIGDFHELHHNFLTPISCQWIANGRAWKGRGMSDYA
jgi:hypothetical protein